MSTDVIGTVYYVTRNCGRVLTEEEKLVSLLTSSVMDSRIWTKSILQELGQTVSLINRYGSYEEK